MPSILVILTLDFSAFHIIFIPTSPYSPIHVTCMHVYYFTCTSINLDAPSLLN